MTARLRLVHFHEDPFLDSGDEVRFVEGLAPLVTDAAGVLLAQVLKVLRTVRTMNPPQPSARITFGDVMELPASVVDPVQWVQMMLRGGFRTKERA